MNPLDGYDKPSPLSKNQKKIYSAVGVAILLIIVWVFTVGHGRGPSAYGNGDGSIDVFPQADAAKNYRLDAQIEVYGKAKTLFSNYKQYDVNSAVWPDGGELQFKNGPCVVTSTTNRSLCTAEDGRSYYIEVISAPDFNSD